MNNFLLNITYPGINPDPSWAPNPIAFSIGGMEIAWYGILFTFGFIAAIALAIVKIEYWYKVSSAPFYHFVFIGIPVSILGARIWSFMIGDAAKLLETQNFFQAFFNFREGGLAIQGGVLFTVIAACIYFPLILKKPKYHIKTQVNKEFYVKQVSMWVYADAIIPCILVGQIIGRWGNFMNQEVYGPLVASGDIDSMNWLKTVMPGVWRGMFIYENGVLKGFYQPFFLYESFANFWVFLILYVGFEFIEKRKTGDIGISYFIFYGIVRLIMEPFRSGPFQFSFSIVTSVLFILIGISLIIANHFYFSKNRNFRFFDYFIFVIKYLYLKTIKKNNSINIKNKEKFYRKPEEIYYYRGQ